MPHTQKLQTYFHSAAFLQGQSGRFSALKLIVEDLVSDIHQAKADAYGLQLPNSETIRLIHGCSSCNANVAPARVAAEQFAQMWLAKSQNQITTANNSTASALNKLSQIASNSAQQATPPSAQRLQRKSLLGKPTTNSRRKRYKSS